MSTSQSRVESIDVFRGLTIFIMILVNDLASVRDIPGWLKHMPAEIDGMTFVDVVFPTFLFIVGMSIPFALNKRIRKGETFTQIWMHILTRTLGLLVLGFFMVNVHFYNERLAGLDNEIWTMLIFVFAILVWNQYPQTENKKNIAAIVLRLTGITGLIMLAIIFKGGTEGNIIWMQTRWWGILGLIGWAYLTSCLFYFLFKKYHSAVIGSAAFLFLLFIGDKEGALGFLSPVGGIIWIGGFIGTHSAITMIGVSVSMLFLREYKELTPARRILWILTFALILYLCGSFLRPLYIISKNLATPSWGLISASVSAAIFAFLYWLVDLKKINRWSFIIKPAGTNPLLAYILPDLIYPLFTLFGMSFYSRALGSGLIGLMRSIVFAFIIVGLTNLLTALKVKLHL